MQYRDLLLALGLQEKIDIDQVLETGSCLVRMDHSGGKALELTLECDNERQVVWLYAPLGRVKAEARADVYGMLLRMHLFGLATGGAYFGFDAQRDTINLFKSIRLASAVAPDAARQVKAFVNDVQAMLQTLPVEPDTAMTGAGLNHMTLLTGSSAGAGGMASPQQV
ncbi:type III secretion system chaperone [Robbsia andropogonis]|nr:type III secretion system chaperone [Robbsia andropogonis]